jgi:hypothetical protein
MSSTALVSDQMIEFFGELYRHEPSELRSRVQFRDYLDLLLRNQEPVRFHGPSHVHRCACGTFLLCERPANSECGREPRCRDCYAAVDLAAIEDLTPRANSRAGGCQPGPNEGNPW